MPSTCGHWGCCGRCIRNAPPTGSCSASTATERFPRLLPFLFSLFPLHLLLHLHLQLIPSFFLSVLICKLFLFVNHLFLHLYLLLDNLPNERNDDRTRRSIGRAKDRETPGVVLGGEGGEGDEDEEKGQRHRQRPRVRQQQQRRVHEHLRKIVRRRAVFEQSSLWDKVFPSNKVCLRGRRKSKPC